MTSVDILGVRVDDVTYAEAADRVETLIQRGGAHQVATVNSEFIMAARSDEEFMQVLQRTALNVPDGAGVLWAARRQGAPLRERVAGVDLVIKLCEMASRHGWRVFLLGARPGVAERAAANLALRFPALRVAGTYAGSPARDEENVIVERICAAHPQLVFVAFGAPAQDQWLARNLSMLATTPDPTPNPSPAGEGCLGLVGIGVGGAFDFIAGMQKRAPEWMQHANLEWLYRLWREPWRWRRQTALLRFACAVMLKSR
jgi:N-acetylglucosaminyldiphosphoundecaprenol N-acetyl-beta-D-mannosaminyltransferase